MIDGASTRRGLASRRRTLLLLLAGIGVSVVGVASLVATQTGLAQSADDDDELTIPWGWWAGYLQYLYIKITGLEPEMFYEYPRCFPWCVDDEEDDRPYPFLNTECPLDSPTASLDEKFEGSLYLSKDTDTYFCGMLFRKISSPQYLANWKAIEAREDDVWFATLPPSGMAKKPGMDLISELTGAIAVSGHTEFHDWENDPTGSELKVEGLSTFNTYGRRSLSEDTYFPDFPADKRRLIGTHMPYEWLPTSVLFTPPWRKPVKVVFVVREPKENMAAAAAFMARPPKGTGVVTSSDVDDFLNPHVRATGQYGYSGSIVSENDYVKEGETANRGFAAYNNGYAAAVGAGKNGGPEVFLLSQTRLAAGGEVLENEVKQLADFLGIEVPADIDLSKTQESAADQIGDWEGVMTEEQAQLADTAFSAATAVDPRVVELYSA